MHRVFLDANVLFSAAWRENAGLLRLWNRLDLKLIASSFAIQEADSNLPDTNRKQRLAELVRQVEIVPVPLLPPEVGDVDLPDKDRPILQAAIQAGAGFLVTGDRMHFGRYYGETIQGVTILPPADLLKRLS
jgi:predicted nucleic acid-binding protein